jgi:hypothetical protein
MRDPVTTHKVALQTIEKYRSCFENFSRTNYGLTCKITNDAIVKKRTSHSLINFYARALRMMLQIVDQIILTTSPQQAMHQSKLQIFFFVKSMPAMKQREREREEKIVSFCYGHNSDFNFPNTT